MSELSERLRKAYAWACEMWAGDEAPEKDSCAALCKEAADEIDRLTRERDEARAVVERLPKDENGDPILVNDTVWWIGTDGKAHKWIPYMAIEDERQWYRTREAAEAARHA